MKVLHRTCVMTGPATRRETERIGREGANERRESGDAGGRYSPFSGHRSHPARAASKFFLICSLAALYYRLTIRYAFSVRIARIVMFALWERGRFCYGVDALQGSARHQTEGNPPRLLDTFYRNSLGLVAFLPSPNVLTRALQRTIRSTLLLVRVYSIIPVDLQRPQLNSPVSS